jgi:transposase
VAQKQAVEELSTQEMIALIFRLQQQVAELLKENQELKRSAHRQAAPFSKGKPVINPKKPGRKPGQGPFKRREAPLGPPDIVIEAQAPPSCPDCGGSLELDGYETPTVTDLPEQPKPKVTGYRVPVCHCRNCGKRVRGAAAGLAPDQHGATAHRMGPGLKAAALTLHYGIGVPMRKVPVILKELAGVSITQSAVTQEALRCAKGAVGAEYERLRDGIQARPFVHTDDTGWRVKGKPAFLMGFESDQAAVYQIRTQHRNEEVREIIPGDYPGVMITDRGRSYDANELANVDQQKCLGHILRNIQDVVETKRGWARRFGLKTKALLQDGMALWRARQGLPEAEFAAKANKITTDLTYHLRNRILEDDDNQRLLNRLGTHDDNGHLTRFLSEPFVEPTNNRAGRMLRPAVIHRKVSACSKNEDGAYAFAAFSSIAQTARKAGASVSATFRRFLQGPAPSPAQ